ncbi:ankyrin repeat domain-containing protein [Kineosporia sp. NBRC 101731]|uniref:ankyrin repeat domain-containing protein n=1 Tax=Kineosporia sp. NBRC 101731 TaxID=3032199 RepID=UPI002556BC10|nr:ankyrin repeat domain-containing protein [Kineosporia sp. NBRC 101731]
MSEHVASSDALSEAAGNGDLRAVRALLKCGVGVDGTSSRGDTALVAAVEHHHVEVARELLAAGADPDQRMGQGRESFPLRYAAMHGLLPMACVLLEAEATVQGHPLSQVRMPEVVLRQIRSDLEIRAAPQFVARSPLTEAAGRGHTDIVRLLLEHGADPNDPKTTTGEPLRTAAYGGHPGVVRLLMERGARIGADTLVWARRGAARPGAHVDAYTEVFTLLTAKYGGLPS